MRRLLLSRSFAFSEIFKSKGLIFLIVLGMSVAFVAIVTTFSAIQGLNNMIISGETGWLGELVIRPNSGQASIKNIAVVKAELDKISEIKSYSVRDYGVFVVKYKDQFYQPHVSIGVNEQAQDVSKFDSKMVSGNFVSPEKPNEVVVGVLLAKAFKGNAYAKNTDSIKIGETIEVVSQSGVRKTYKIGGIVDAKTFVPNWLLIMDKKQMESLDTTQKDSEIIISLKNPADMQRVKGIIESKNLGVMVYTWREVSGYADDLLSGISIIGIVINGLIVVTVFVIVCIIIFINVLQKKRQIGILKSMGANNAFMRNVYIFETLTYVFLACVIGTAIFFCIHLVSNAYPVPMLLGDFKTVFNVETILISIFIMLVAAISGTLIPTFIASRVKIARVIKDNA